MDNEAKNKVIEKLKAEAFYRKSRPIKEIFKERYENMRPFTDEYIPTPPIVNEETYKEIVIPNYIRCGAIPKDKLVVGKKYYGKCRNANIATWLGDKFEYIRTKFGHTYPEKINHFEDDNGLDLFVPIREIE